MDSLFSGTRMKRNTIYELLTNAMHSAAGYIAAKCFRENPIVSFALVLSFLFYEMLDTAMHFLEEGDWRKRKKELAMDLIEFLTGALVACKALY